MDSVVINTTSMQHRAAMIGRHHCLGVATMTRVIRATHGMEDAMTHKGSRSQAAIAILLGSSGIGVAATTEEITADMDVWDAVRHSMHIIMNDA